VANTQLINSQSTAYAQPANAENQSRKGLVDLRCREGLASPATHNITSPQPIRKM
jgi:hypothetical protein